MPTADVLYESEVESDRAFPADIANEVTYDLAGVVTGGTGATASNLGRPAAGKTGNHEGETAWFIGYTPQLVTAVAFHRELPGDPTGSAHRCRLHGPLHRRWLPDVDLDGLHVGGSRSARRCCRFPGRPIPSTSPTPTPTTSSP